MKTVRLFFSTLVLAVMFTANASAQGNAIVTIGGKEYRTALTCEEFHSTKGNANTPCRDLPSGGSRITLPACAEEYLKSIEGDKEALIAFINDLGTIGAEKVCTKYQVVARKVDIDVDKKTKGKKE